MDIRSSEFEKAAFLWDEQGNIKVNCIYVCFDNDSLALNAGLFLRRQVKKSPVRIVMRMNESNGLSRLVDTPDGQQGGHKNLIAFCLLDKICTPEILSHTSRDILARASHEVYFQQDKKERAILSELYFSTPELNAGWEHLTPQERRSHYQWVDHIHALLDTCGYEIIPLFDLDAASYHFSPQEIETMAEKEHELWRRDHAQDGWKEGPAPLNETLKTRPDLVEWQNLAKPTQENIKRLVQSIPAFLVRSGYQVNKL